MMSKPNLIFRSVFWFLFAVLVFGFGAGSAQAQALKLTDGAGENLTVDAEDGIEWHQNDRVFIARGNARAVRGEMTVRADELRAHYRDGSDSSTDIWRMDAFGNVVMSSPGQTAHGGNAVYDVERSILVIRPAPGGPPARLSTGAEEITATGQLEFWSTRNIAVARGQARAVQKNRILSGDVLVAHLVTGKGGDDRVERIEVYDAVKIETPEDTVTADRGTYQVETGIATLVGSVRMQRGGNSLEGCRAVVDTRLGVSQLFSCTGADGAAGRVKGQFAPN